MRLKCFFPAILFASSLAMAAPSPADAQIRLDLGDLTVHVTNSSPPRYVRYERRGRQRNNQMWIKGYWHYNGNRWVWIFGRWEDRRNDRVWIHPTYGRERGEIVYTPGRWSNEQLRYSDSYEQHKKKNNRNNNRKDKRD